MKIPLSVKNQSIESSGITKDFGEALCEFIWNGFEANATTVIISYIPNVLNGIDTITISDNGDGISFDNLSDTFGAFLASQKNSYSLKAKTKANKGKGRFSFSAFSSMAKWNTVYKDNDEFKSFSITLTDANKEEVEFEEPKVIYDRKTTGTEVSFFNISKSIYASDISLEALEYCFLKEFAWFLYLNKHKSIKIILNNQEIDYSKYIDDNFSSTISKRINEFNFKISLIVWNEKIKEKFRSYYFDSNDILKGSDNTSFNNNTVAFNHSVFIQSSFFDKWDKISLFDTSMQIAINEEADDREIIKSLKKEIQELIAEKIKLFMIGKADEEVHKMMTVRKTFPKFSDDEYGKLRKRDLVRVTKELYGFEPRIFYKLNELQEKSLLAFLNLLLGSEERENLLVVVDELVKLSSSQRKQFADTLKKTHLEYIIDTISFVENRYQIIEILKAIIYDLGKYANERDHVQRIIEHNYWLFGEQYNLASADKTMNSALESYNYLLYGAKDATEKLSEETEAERRMDIFLCSSLKDKDSYGVQIEENIVVELKAPNITLSKKVLRQVEDYMDFIRSKPQFNSQYRRWKFIAVAKKVDDDIKNRYETFKDKGRPGLVSLTNNYEIYALTWDDVFEMFDLRHSFMLDKLKYDRDKIAKEINESFSQENRDAVNVLTEKAICEIA